MNILIKFILYNFILISNGLLFAKEIINYSFCNKPLSVAVYENGFLYNTENKSGIIVDVFNEISKKTNCKFNFILMPRARSWIELKSGRIDISASGFMSNERESYSYIIKMWNKKNFVLIRKNMKVNTIEEFIKNKNLEVGIVRGTFHGSKNIEDFIEKLRKENRVQESSEQSNIYLKLANNRVQGIFGNMFVIKKYISEIKELQGNFEILDWASDDEKFKSGIFLSKKTFNNENFKKFEEIIDNLKKNGLIKKYIKKYLTEEEIIKFKVLD
jgi:polar amino acid transport system substrate-binding protein